MTDSTELAQQLDGIIGAIRHAKLQHVATLGALDDAEQRAVAALESLTGEPEPLPEPPKPVMVAYSQNDPRWKDKVYAGGWTFGRGGCYTIGVADIASLAGYTDEPPEVAAKLREVGAYVGAELLHPERIPQAYPRLRWDGAYDWHDLILGDEQMAIVQDELNVGPTIMEVDFVPTTRERNQHFVIAEMFTMHEDNETADLLITDTWNGAACRLLETYALGHWDLKRAIYGLRLLRVAEE
jgi:hypothetical protein